MANEPDSGVIEERRNIMVYAIIGAGLASAYLYKMSKGPSFKWPWQK